jgi:hypothetical protein
MKLIYNYCTFVAMIIISIAIMLMIPIMITIIFMNILTTTV